MTVATKLALNSVPIQDLGDLALVLDKDYEVVDGQLEEKIMGGARHGGVGAKLLARMVVHVEDHQLGGVYGPDTTFTIGSNQRLPDVSFVVASRIPLEGEPDGIWTIAPDLAVEIISPNDLYEKVLSKILEYFAAGVQQVWLVSPKHQMVTIYHSPTNATILTREDELVDDTLLPGFRCQIGDLFRSPARA